MTAPNEDTTEESSDEPIDLPGFGRRPLLKTLGAGTALSMGSGVAAAQDDDSGQDDDDRESDPANIDPQFGLSTSDANIIPEGVEPNREVELHITLNEPGTDHASFYAHFEPTGLHLDSGDVVRFTYESPEHTITAYHPGHGFQQRVPENTPPFSSPVVNEDGAWLYRFEEAGVYDLFCAPHHVFGMNMRIVVGDPDETDYPPSVAESWEDWEEGDLFPPWNRGGLEFELNEFREQNDGAVWAWLTPQEVLDAPVIDPSTIQEQGSVSFEDVLGDVDRFGDTLPEDHETPAVQLREHDEYGDILVGPEELTVYMFDNDTQGEGASACHDDCAEAWPPLTVEDEPTAGEAVEADLTTFEREDGTTQVAANGWPLYHFAEDQAPGDANGQGVGDVWWVLQPDGTPIQPQSSG